MCSRCVAVSYIKCRLVEGVTDLNRILSELDDWNQLSSLFFPHLLQQHKPKCDKIGIKSYDSVVGKINTKKSN